MSDHHLIRLRLGTETDWPTAFETILRRLAVRPVQPASRNAE